MKVAGRICGCLIAAARAAETWAATSALHEFATGNTGHFLRQPGCNLSAENPRLLFVLGPVDGRTEQWITPFVSPGRVKIQEIVLIGKMLGGKPASPT